MSPEPVSLNDLPLALRSAIAAKTGHVKGVEVIQSGQNSPLSLRVTTADGQLFLKGLRDDDQRLATQRREFEISASLCGLAPTARWRVHAEGWYVIAFDYIEGRHAKYHPGSEDLPLVAELLQRLSLVAPPDDVSLRRAEQRLAHYAAAPDDVAHFTGDTLLHTDLNPQNVLITADRAYLVDWAWATRGAAWLDAGYWVICLIADGHEPAEAEAVAGTLPAWRRAFREAVTAFAEANANLWREISSSGGNAWTKAMSDASDQWLAYRKTCDRRSRRHPPRC